MVRISLLFLGYFDPPEADEIEKWFFPIELLPTALLASPNNWGG